MLWHKFSYACSDYWVCFVTCLAPFASAGTEENKIHKVNKEGGAGMGGNAAY